ncbi:MAG: 16S rRNA (guanine(966)-N(2))-methyltransferase RsmD [Deltaproteobacteria bacterium]|nr:MAG: 16S rRNA (guanine(966)-N(2))-methyltransferase RsmD [Deltaproteobacteria bacterium]
MRVIGGSCKKKSLKTLRGMELRPTPDRIREAIFSIIVDELPDSNVLDLYAGSGTLGIEALSRGAKDAVFIENHLEAIRVLKKNLESCQLVNRGMVIRRRVETAIRLLGGKRKIFDLIFLDPPYEKDLVGKTLKALSSSSILKPGSLVVVQHSRRETIPEALGRLVFTDQRRYGETLISFFRAN